MAIDKALAFERAFEDLAHALNWSKQANITTDWLMGQLDLKKYAVLITEHDIDENSYELIMFDKNQSDYSNDWFIIYQARGEYIKLLYQKALAWQHGYTYDDQQSKFMKGGN